MANFDGLRGAVVAGEGIVARFPGLVCVARWSDTVDPKHICRLLELCREAAGTAPGRVLARRLAFWLGGVDGPSDGLTFGTVAVTGDDGDDGLAVFLSGQVSALVPEVGTRISGEDAVAWTDRLLKRPDTAMVLTIDGVDTPPELLEGVHDLRGGVVPGSAIVLLASDTPWPVISGESASGLSAPSAPQAAEPAPEPPTRHGPEHAAPVPPSGPDPRSEPREPRRSEPILGSVSAEESRPPLDIGVPVGARTGSVPAGEANAQINGSEEPQATGHLCSRGHLNDPRSHFCVLCGIRMNQQTGVLVIGSRPPLGLLVFDDGSTYTVDAEYLVGRMPDVDERVRSGSLRSIVVEDRSGTVSRVHAEVRLKGWDVVLVDSGSRNGTFIAAPGQDAWALLSPSESRRLEPGTRVRLGGRTFTFESPSGVR
ncbi:MAG: FHA domain-containing protein [Pseudonocardia sp.]